LPPPAWWRGPADKTGPLLARSLGGRHAVRVDREAHGLLRVALRLGLGDPAREGCGRMALDRAGRDGAYLQEPARDGDVVRWAGRGRRHDRVGVNDRRGVGGGDDRGAVQAVGACWALRALRAHRAGCSGLAGRAGVAVLAGGTLWSLGSDEALETLRSHRAGRAHRAVMAVQAVQPWQTLRALGAGRAGVALRADRAHRADGTHCAWRT